MENTRIQIVYENLLTIDEQRKDSIFPEIKSSIAEIKIVRN